MASSFVFKLCRPSLLTQLVSCRKHVHFCTKKLLLVTCNCHIVGAGISPVVCRCSREAGDGKQTVLQRQPTGEDQSLSGSEQNRPSLWRSGAHGGSRVKGTNKVQALHFHNTITSLLNPVFPSREASCQMSSKSSPTDPRSSEPSSPTTMSLWAKRQVCVFVFHLWPTLASLCVHTEVVKDCLSHLTAGLNTLSNIQFLTGCTQCLPGPVNYLFHWIIYLSSTSLGSLLHSSTAEECGLNKHNKSQYTFWCSPLYLGCCFGMKMTVHELLVNLFITVTWASWRLSQSVLAFPGLFWIVLDCFEFSLGIVGMTPWHRFSSGWRAPIWCAVCCKDCLLSVSNTISISAVAQCYGVVETSSLTFTFYFLVVFH